MIEPRTLFSPATAGEILLKNGLGAYVRYPENQVQVTVLT